MFLFLIDNPIDQPAVGRAIAKDPVDRAVAKRDVPFVAIPEAVTLARLVTAAPPVARRPPRPRTRDHRAAGVPAAIGGDAHRPPLGVDGDARRYRLTASPQRRHRTVGRATALPLAAGMVRGEWR